MGQEQVEMWQDGLREEKAAARSTQIQIKNLQGFAKCQKPELEERVCNRHSFVPSQSIFVVKEWEARWDYCFFLCQNIFFFFLKAICIFFFFSKRHFAFQTRGKERKKSSGGESGKNNAQMSDTKAFPSMSIRRCPLRHFPFFLGKFSPSSTNLTRFLCLSGLPL